MACGRIARFDPQRSLDRVETAECQRYLRRLPGSAAMGEPPSMVRACAAIQGQGGPPAHGGRGDRDISAGRGGPIHGQAFDPERTVVRDSDYAEHVTAS